MIRRLFRFLFGRRRTRPVTMIENVRPMSSQDASRLQ